MVLERVGELVSSGGRGITATIVFVNCSSFKLWSKLSFLGSKFSCKAILELFSYEFLSSYKIACRSNFS